MSMYCVVVVTCSDKLRILFPNFAVPLSSMEGLSTFQRENSELTWGLHGFKFNSPLCLLYNCYITRNLRLQRDPSTSVFISSAKCRGKKLQNVNY